MSINFGPGFHAPGCQPFDADACEQYFGRWSRLFVPAVLNAAEVAAGDRVLDVATGRASPSESASAGWTRRACDRRRPLAVNAVGGERAGGP
jgi:hypothetical protein